MMIQAIAIDDEIPALKVLENFCAKVDYIHLQQTFNQPDKALKYLCKSPVDLLFLDINMPSITGTDLYRSIEQKMMVIFTTAHSEYAVEGFNLNALDYLLKPFTFERFLQAAEKAKLFQPPPPPLIFRIDYSLVKVNPPDILFIEGLDDYLKIHLLQQPPLIVRMTMKAMMEKLPASAFVRVHRSFIVPLAHIEQVRNKIILIAGNEIPVGSSYEAGFFSQFKM
ncbi:LytR/AlgR family response regulator transcription factor [Chitinophaga sp. YR573]|uniref:LytR/AlgR family response regulator transcription factor n=1 Tax=Chitinophaga sp. YR573 TaxID=1881040 RepID=UPI000B800FEE|nr:LytTR family DNA-binding domain-containing protein [Chitinophaga sp. YR573]